MSSYRRRKRSTKSQQNRLNSTPTMEKSKSVPNIRQNVDWPGQIDDKYVEDVKNRLNVIEVAAVSDEMVRAFLAANDNKPRHAVEALKKCVEWRKGRQMFWNNYRQQNERYQFLTQIRKVGRGTASTFGHTKNGRLLFYEKIGENFNMSLYKEFTQSEFIDHVIVWCENLLNFALANAGKPTHLINEIPFYENEQSENGKDDDQKGNVPITPSFEQQNGSTFPDTETMDDKGNDDKDITATVIEEKYKHKFEKFEIKNNCNFTDVVGIIDWKGCNVETFIENKALLIAAEELLSTYYPHLINTIYHINMPLNFEKIENALKSNVSSQILKKSIFLESQETKAKRIDFMKKHGKPSIKSRRNNSRNRRKKDKDTEDEQIKTDIDALDEWSRGELLEIVSSQFLPKEYGGEIDISSIYTYVEPIYRDLVGVSSEAVPSGYEEFMDTEAEELKSWKSHALRSLERHTERIPVKRGEHFIWQYTAEYDRKLIFGVTFEADGFRGKSIKVIVREETEQITGYCPMFGDFIVLKDGNLVFQFRNIKGGKRLNLQYKIEKHVFPKSFVNKHLPDYHAEERFIQSKTLNIGGKNVRGSRSGRTPSEYSGSTVLSTSPPPDLSSLRVNKSEKRKSAKQNSKKDLLQTSHEEELRNKSKKSKSHRPKKSKKKVVKKKKSSKQRAKTPEPPNTPISEEYE